MQIFDGNYDEIHDWIVRGQGVAEAAARYPGRFIPLVYLNPLEGADICRENDPHGSRTRRLHRRRAQDGKALPKHLS